jgi:hypothetical protein
MRGLRSARQLQRPGQWVLERNQSNICQSHDLLSGHFRKFNLFGFLVVAQSQKHGLPQLFRSSPFLKGNLGNQAGFKMSDLLFARQIHHRGSFPNQRPELLGKLSQAFV